MNKYKFKKKLSNLQKGDFFFLLNLNLSYLFKITALFVRGLFRYTSFGQQHISFQLFPQIFTKLKNSVWTNFWGRIMFNRCIWSSNYEIILHVPQCPVCKFLLQLFRYLQPFFRGSTLVNVLCYKSEVRWFPDCIIEIFHWHNPSNPTMALGWTQPQTEMSTRRISWGGEKRPVREADYLTNILCLCHVFCEP